MEDRNIILDHLEQARRHVAEAEQRIAHQREIVAQLTRDGHDTHEAKRLLDQFEQTHALQVDDRNRLGKELVEASE
jgi:archaellum component FlaC